MCVQLHQPWCPGTESHLTPFSLVCYSMAASNCDINCDESGDSLNLFTYTKLTANNTLLGWLYFPLLEVLEFSVWLIALMSFTQEGIRLVDYNFIIHTTSYWSYDIRWSEFFTASYRSYAIGQLELFNSFHVILKPCDCSVKNFSRILDAKESNAFKRSIIPFMYMANPIRVNLTRYPRVW